MKQNSEVLINNLIVLTTEFITQAEILMAEPLNDLNFKSDHDTWSVLETIEHLNLYGDFYIPEIKKQINNSTFKSSKEFKSGVLGGYFVKILKPRVKLNKMKTLKDKNPNGSALDKKVIVKFIDQQKEILKLLNRSHQVDLTKTKTAISISKIIKLRLGDTLGVVVFHNQRHIIQAKNALSLSQKV